MGTVSDVVAELTGSPALTVAEHLARHPELQQQLREQPGRTGAALEV